MNYGSVCSGIAADAVAWAGLDFSPAWFCENAPFPSAVLNYYYPKVENLGDLKLIHEKETYERQPIDLLFGGTPCQDFSSAGKQQGLAGDRSVLVWDYIRILAEKRPRWFVWENVPNARSTNRGRDFEALIREMENVGYCVAWRILDAQYFGLAQRRKRLFVVGYRGDWRPPFAVLHNPEGLRGNPKPRKAQRQTDAGVVANCLRSSGPGGNRVGDSRGQDTVVVSEVSPPLTKSGPWNGYDYENGGIVYATQPRIARNGRGTPEQIAPALTANAGKTGKGDSAPIVFELQQITSKESRQNVDQSVSRTLCAGGKMSIGGKMGVRRLTPREWERLQGFPDDYTLIPYGGKGKLAKDSPRYEALGNSMPVPVIRWIGERILMVEKIINK